MKNIKIDSTACHHLRIVLLSFGFIDYTIQLANELSKKGLSVLLIMPDNQIQDHIDSIENNVTTYIYIQPRLYDIANIFLMNKIYTRICSFNPSIIHIQGGHLWFSILLPVLRIRKYAMVTTFHDPTPHVGENNLRSRFVHCLGRKYSDKIIVHGEKLKKIMMEKYNVANNTICITSIGEHNVTPFKKYMSNDIKETGNLILFFGRIWGYKGLNYLIKSEPMISKKVPNVKIIIAGRGEMFKKYEDMMVNRDNFIVHNYRIPYKEGSELFQRCSIVVLPYIEASQSGVIPTAYGFKKPVVVTNVGSIPEIVDDGLTGFIVPPKDPEALANAIVRLLKDEKLRRMMGENAYKKLKSDLSWDTIAENTIVVYKSAVEA